MKRSTVILAMVLLFCSLLSVSAVHAETCRFNDELELTDGIRYTCTTEEKYFIITDNSQDKTIFADVEDAEELGLTADLLNVFFMDSGMMAILFEDIQFEEGPLTTGNVTWYWGTTDLDGSSVYTAPALVDKYLLIFMFMDGTKTDAEALIQSIRLTNADSTVEKPASAPPAAKDGQIRVTGFYNAKMSALSNDVFLILSPLGHARLVSYDDNATFNYSWDGSEFTIDDDEGALSMNADGSISLTASGFTIEFVKRSDPEDPAGFTGDWELNSLSMDGINFSRSTLETLNHIITMTVYSDGTIDYHDGEDNVAQGWGYDEGGYYFISGRGRSAASITGSSLVLVFPTDDGDATMIFEKTSGSGSDTAGGSGGGKILF